MSKKETVIRLFEYDDKHRLESCRDFFEYVDRIAHRWLVTSGRKESVYRSLAAAKKVAGKRGKITPLYK